MLDIHEIMKSLSGKSEDSKKSEIRQIFHSEADFQFALAWAIKEKYKDLKIMLEVPVSLDRRRRIDIIVKDNEGSYPIELKYLRKNLRCSVNSESYNLRAGAHDLEMESCFSDIRRLEMLRNKEDDIGNFVTGYAIWLTNNPVFWEPYRKDNENKPLWVNYHAPSGSNITPDKNKYTVKWEPYSELVDNNGNKAEFKYTVIEVKKEG